MEKLNPDNIEQPIIPATWDQMGKEIPECVNALVLAALGAGPGGSDALPIWYVMTKAAAASGLPLATLYNDPLARQHALAVMAADAQAAAKHAQAVHFQQQIQEGAEPQPVEKLTKRAPGSRSRAKKS